MVTPLKTAKLMTNFITHSTEIEVNCIWRMTSEKLKYFRKFNILSDFIF